jgi:carbon storage regulator CsrA
MLVLSRRENETIVFANLGIQVEIVRVAGKVARLGIRAPRDVHVLRGELVSRNDSSPADEQATTHSGMNLGTDSARERRHAMRNRLNKAMLGLQVLQANLEAGQTADLEGLSYKIFQNLQDLNEELQGGTAAEKPAERLAERLAEKSISPPRALIVDDNANEAELLAQFLQLNGYATDVAQNGREAISWLQQNELPEVVLMDMNMPEMDGMAAIQRIREDRDLNAVRLFGVSGLEQEEAGFETGDGVVERWFTKPVDARRLVEEMRRPRSAQRA